MNTHALKSWPEYFVLLTTEDRTFDLRRNDRHFVPGDVIQFEEYRPQTNEYTGRVLRRRINYVLKDTDSVGMDGLQKGWCILGLEPDGRDE
jgi:hypothetical protein